MSAIQWSSFSSTDLYLAFVTPEASRKDCHCTKRAKVKVERKTMAIVVVDTVDPSL
jgi:hypothetical protein